MPAQERPESRPPQQGMMAMSNAKLGGRSNYRSFGAASDRRARRADRQFLVSNVVVAVSFLFVSAVVFGLVG